MNDDDELMQIPEPTPEETIAYLATRVRKLEQDLASERRYHNLANGVLHDMGIYTWKGVDATVEIKPEDKEKLTYLIGSGYALTKLDEAIRENSAAAYYWTKLLTCLKLGDEDGKFGL